MKVTIKQKDKEITELKKVSYTFPRLCFRRLYSKIAYGCRAMKTKGMVFRYTWVYSKNDTMAHTRRLVVIS